MQRKVVPELLDHLPQNDPHAVRSRADLRRVNFVMGNERWILRNLRQHADVVRHGVCEWGAGEGTLTARIAKNFPDAKVTAHDLASSPRFPPDISGRIEWKQGDLFSAPSPAGGVLIANLFLHHFEGDALIDLGKRCQNFHLLLFSEPDLARLPLIHAWLASPFVNHVTRHDMRVSILAGFQRGEIQRLMGLDSAQWEIDETSTWRGARRVIASRR